MTNTFNTTSE